MPNGFKVKADARAVQRSLTRLRSFFDDMRPALQNAATELTRRVWYRFAFKRDPDGRRWSPWAASTAAQAAGNPRRKLMLYSRSLRDNSRFIAGRKDLRAVLGTAYGAVHEQPNGPINGRVPRRAFMFSRKNGNRALARNDEAYLLNAVRYQIRKASADK